MIFSKSHKQKCLIPTESCFLDGKKLNIAKLVDINFLADNEKNRQAIGFCRNGMVYGFFAANSMKMCFFWVFLHAEFISALKTEPKSMVFEKLAKNEKKYLSSLFSNFCDFL